MTEYEGPEYVKRARQLLKLLESHDLLDEYKRIEDVICFSSTGNELAFGLSAEYSKLLLTPSDFPEEVGAMAQTLSQEVENLIEAS